jgi:heme-degrading monooxygenase HmoA
VTIKPGLESTFFERARMVAGELERSHGMLFHLVGRRAVAQYTEVCGITLWESGSPLSDRQAVLPGTEELADCYAAPPSTHEYEPVVT